MIAQQTFQPTPATPTREIYQMFIRHQDDGTTLNTADNYADAIAYRDVSTMKAWQLRRWDNVQKRMAMIACSTNWFFATPARARKTIERDGLEVVDGLMVEHGLDNTYIYFTDTARQFDSCLKVYSGHSMTIVGNVTSENYDGFLKAVALAPRYMHRPIPI